MGKLALIFVLFLGACSNTAMYTATGHYKQSDIVESALQEAMEYNADGIISYWYDPNSGKSGAVKPLYASYDWAPPCRYFELAYFYPDKQPTYHYGQACKRGQVWRIH
jgi:hypothetical protein